MKNKVIFPLFILFLLIANCALAPADLSVDASSTSAPAAAVQAHQQESIQPAAESIVDSEQQSTSSNNAETASADSEQMLSYTIVDTGQGQCYDDRQDSNCPTDGSSFYGQDAQYAGNQPDYQDNGDGTVTDLTTGLMWTQDDGEKVTHSQALANAEALTTGGYDDWRLPTIKELYSLILFDGTDPSGGSSVIIVTPFIDHNTFAFEYGNETGGRVIDSQYWSSTVYVSTTMGGAETVFGVNFADGRIKGYPASNPRGQEMTQFARYVRGNTDYGQNDFVDNGNGTISDQATGLTWMQTDNGEGVDWGDALAYCEALDYGGSSDWRLPNAKELQSIVDYSRSPDTTNSAAIDPLFSASVITNEAGQSDYPYYWSSTTHANSNGMGGNAAYVAFGRSMGNMNGNGWIDVHGAGSQRSDPKSGDPSQWSDGHGPQGDSIRIDNYVRCVSGGTASSDPDGSPETRQSMEVQDSSSSTAAGGPPSGAPSGQQPSGQGNDQLPPPRDGQLPPPPKN